MYEVDNEIIHDQKAMWHLALSFKGRYNFLKEQLANYKRDNCILYEGELIFKSRDGKLFEKIVRQYTQDLAAIERVIDQDIKLNSNGNEHYVKYVRNTKDIS